MCYDERTTEETSVPTRTQAWLEPRTIDNHQHIRSGNTEDLARVARILLGEIPGNLPVQSPSLFEFGINLRTAKAMGIDMPQSLIIAADEVVE